MKNNQPHFEIQNTKKGKLKGTFKTTNTLKKKTKQSKN